ncbi:MAG: 5-formyltetrahydrofolate cyclo-ligase [Rhizobiales bacterium]|jgi:5-formyltetrahydrofolate cyclo-ligase|nr:5-formyltetrahydrofolate cyclo-ligase [Hyphomicrobiales bacterium]
MPVSIPEQKRALRKEMAAKRDALSPIFRKQMSEKVAQADLPFGVPEGAVVSGWFAMGTELNPYPLMKRIAEEDGSSLALPAIADGELVFRAWVPGMELKRVGFGLSEPGPEAKEVDPDILLVPLLAFDLKGYRIGYGKAFFDRGLARLRAKKKIIAVGLAFDEQCVETVPTEPHDERLDYVITEEGVRFSAGT